ncbi:MAG TPA: hypothetical protein VK901_10720 [Nitrospiraceae bacterium]|nr:hypothetical protein [Nitrospiraceae bacterium]
MNPYSATGLLLAATMALTACATGATGQRPLEKNAQSDELRKETTVGVPLPPGCPTQTMSLPAGQTHLTVSYQEPTADEHNIPLKDLAYTTIYVSAPHSTAQAIRVWTNNPHGGARVTIHNVAAPAQAVELCVTATNWARKESAPAPPTQPRP